MQTDPLADFLTQIRNANTAKLPELLTPYSRMKSDVANILKQEGYVDDVEVVKKDEEGFQALKVTMKVTKRDKPIRGIKRVSRPGLRKYVSVKDIPRVLGGLGISVISTSSGVMTGDEAKKQNVGGELLLMVW
ncbi:MAG: 30S ribosomal protein S8 [Verrucomicrobiota bacterium]